MTTTPDSRIRADFGMDGSIATDQFSTADIKLRPLRGAQPTKPIDTSTTAGKVAVMQQAHEDGRNVQYRFKKKEMDWEFVGGRPLWDWDTTDYRIAPPPKPMDPYSRAKRYLENSKRGVIDGVFCDLVDALESAQRVYVHHNHPIYTETGQSVTPGRYRLLRDDQ